MNFKKIVLVFILFCSALFVFLRPVHSPEVPRKISQIQFVLDWGESIATYSGVSASTALEALEVVSEKHQIPIHKTQFDFGVFVDSIGTYSGTANKVWIYHVNGVSGDVAADKKILKEKDVVLWRYMKPSY